jgi:hypothetical protein
VVVAYFIMPEDDEEKCDLKTVEWRRVKKIERDKRIREDNLS